MKISRSGAVAAARTRKRPMSSVRKPGRAGFVEEQVHAFGGQCAGGGLERLGGGGQIPLVALDDVPPRSMRRPHEHAEQREGRTDDEQDDFAGLETGQTRRGDGQPVDALTAVEHGDQLVQRLGCVLAGAGAGDVQCPLGQSVSVFLGDCQQGAQVGGVLGGEATAPGERARAPSPARRRAPVPRNARSRWSSTVRTRTCIGSETSARVRPGWRRSRARRSRCVRVGDSRG